MPDGYYNIAASASDGFTFTVSGFKAGGFYMVKASNSNGSFQNSLGSPQANPSTAFSFTVDEATISATAGVTFASGQQIYFQVQSINSDFSQHGTVSATVSNGYGGNNSFYIDKTAPTVTGVDDQYVKSGATVTVTGTGFATPANATAQIKVSNQSYNIVSVDSDTQLKFTVGAGNFRDYIIVTDKAGNSNSTGQQLTVDNIAPVVSSVNKNSIKNGGTAVITGSGFQTLPASPIAASGVKVNNATTGISGHSVNSDTEITLTATTGDVAHSVITVTDEAGNTSTATNVKIAIDNTAPSISGITDTGGNAKSLGKSGDQIEIRGSGFVLTGTDDSIVKFAGQATADLGITVNSITNTKITLTLGNSEVSGAQVTVTDEAENVGTGGNFTIDNTKPTVSSVAHVILKMEQLPL